MPPRWYRMHFERLRHFQAGLHLAENVHLLRPPQAMYVSIEIPEQHGSDNLDQYVHQVYGKNN